MGDFIEVNTVYIVHVHRKPLFEKFRFQVSLPEQALGMFAPLSQGDLHFPQHLIIKIVNHRKLREMNNEQL